MRNVRIDHMAAEITKGLVEYADLATNTVKNGVKVASREVKKEIEKSAPNNTGAYKKSWTTKKIYENSNAIVITVHSKNRYQLAHLLEHGHAKRGGGRVRSIPHIKQAEEKGVKMLNAKIERELKK